MGKGEMTMKVLFLQPPMGGWVTWGRHVAINVNHAQLAANLREWHPEVRVEVLDCRALELDQARMLRAVEEMAPDLVYMGDALQTTGVAAVLPRYREAARLIKERLPRTKVCVGGFFVGANAPWVLERCPEFDLAICGETEVTFPELAAELGRSEPDLPSVKGIAYREGDQITVTPYRPLLADLDQMPLPAYDLFPMDRYVGFSRIRGYVETYCSRGCPNGCRFCVGWTNYDPRGNGDWTCWRARSAQRVADELELLERRFGARFVVMMDEDFNVDRSRVEQLVEEIRRRGLRLKWFFMGRAPYFLRDADLLPEMRRAGFICGLFGLEAVDGETLRRIRKGITVDQVAEAVARFREHRIMSVVTWMVGFPEDDEAAIRERFERIDRIDPDLIALQIMTPLPGIPMYEELREFIEDWDLARWDFQHPVVRTRWLSREELGRLAAWANRASRSGLS